MRKRTFIFTVVILLIFALLTYQGIKGSSDTYGFDLINYPLGVLEHGISTFTRSVENFFNSYILIVGKEDENRRLEEQVGKIEKERNEYLEDRLENRRLRSLLGLKSQRSDYVAAASVFARDPTNWFQTLRIDKGLRDGIFRDMIAVTDLGAVGRIDRVLNKTAKVMLLTDVNSSVAARIQSSRIEGILEGRGGDKCYLKYVPQDIDVSKGDRIITSGLDGIYPEGLMIGTVTDVSKESGEFFQMIEVTPAQRLSAVEEVIVLKRQ